MTASVDELLQTTRSAAQRLNGLRTDNGKLVNEYLQAAKRTTDGGQAPIAVELLLLGIEDASCTAQLFIQMQLHEADRQRCKMQIQRLTGENKWLREELARLRNRFSESEQEKARLEVELEHYKFQQELQRQTTVADEFPAGSTFVIESSGEETLQATGQEEANCSPAVGGMTSLSSSSVLTTTSAYGGFPAHGNGDAGDMPPRLRTLRNLVIHYASQHRYDVAVPLCQQTLEDLEKTTGRNHPDVATMLNILALVYRDQNKFREATELLKEALAIREEHFGPDNPAVAATLNNLAVLHGRRGRYKEAEALCTRALAIREKHLGPDHADVAKQLANIALVCLNQQKYENAYSCYKRAISIYSKCLDPRDPTVLRTKIALASAYVRANQLANAESTLRGVIPCPLENDSDDDSYFDYQLGAGAAKVLASALKRRGETEDADKIEAVLNGGAGRRADLLSFLWSLLNDDQRSCKSKDSSQIGFDEGKSEEELHEA